MTNPGGGVSDAKFAVIITAVVVLVVLAFASIVGLEIANRPVSVVVQLEGSFLAPIVIGLLTYAKVGKIEYAIHNGVQDSTAAKTAALLRGTAVPGGLRASDPPASATSPVPLPLPIYPEPPPPTPPG